MAPSPRVMRSLSLPSLLLLLIGAATAATDTRFIDCPSNTNYTRGGVFQANLDALLSFLPAAASAGSGFAQNATGVAPDEAYGLAQCRADVNASDCRACLDDAASKCPGQKSSMLIYDYCLLRHSNASFFGAVNTTPVLGLCNTGNAMQPEQFMTQLGLLMSNLTSRGAYSSPRMFVAGATDLTSFKKIYGMAQCTRDLGGDDCNLCLTAAVSSIPTSCDGKQGGQIISPSCSVRYEEYLFYNAQAVEAAMSQPSPAGGGFNGTDHSGPAERVGGNSATVKIALAVSIPVAAVLLVLLTIASCFLCKRTNKQPHKHAQLSRADSEDGQDMKSSESLLYDLSTLRAATDNFNEETKLLCVRCSTSDARTTLDQMAPRLAREHARLRARCRMGGRSR